MKNEIVIFENQDVKLEVNLKGETVWLSLEQMVKLFGRDRTVISRHINSIFKDNELDRKEVCAKFAHTTRHGSLSYKTHYIVGKNVRNTIKKNGGTMPEDLKTPSKSLKELEKESKLLK